MSEVVTCRNLSKKFGDFIAVNDISFTVDVGEIFGLIGPNGEDYTETLTLEELREGRRSGKFAPRVKHNLVIPVCDNEK